MAPVQTAAGATRPIPTSPTGLGTSAARLTELLRPRTPSSVPASVPPRAAAPAQAARGRTLPDLYCPPHLRDDPALGEEVNERLVRWAGQVGIYAGQAEKFRAANYGRLLMLTHPDTDDPDRLLAAARCMAAEFAVDDYFCDEAAAGQHPERLGPQLMLAQSAIDPAQLPSGARESYERAMREQPVLNALRRSVEDLGRYASGSQVNRLRQEIAGLFLGMDCEAGWRIGGSPPPVWEYLANRQMNSFLPCLALVDAIGGYELPANVYGRPDVRRATLQAALASVLLNDVYSMHKEGGADGVEYNLPTVIAAEQGCSLDDAVRRSADLHNELMHSFEAAAAALTLTGDPLLTRYLGGLWAWLGGNKEWHASSPRYNQ
ncbi:family 2 encapsulin nanocompartment cargo protein terpene cyclase [Kitasatospora sp. MAP5-34]|uniref:family 2 encapsulin nanocompartment cargo protein terpene cyclase n=1 Tax=Kitasatospora sp. MAP5-34 TaxID=3035102 RepID=UPI0024737AC4|nr:family 2 encapsulin nanocompartment cargo protein terpene cyclase [Kitasatospora sp. MAP5-34]MDH6575894.1 2-methylisoborneol synthase [Kitasatospora sp. MAP5-34]